MSAFAQLQALAAMTIPEANGAHGPLGTGPHSNPLAGGHADEAGPDLKARYKSIIDALRLIEKETEDGTPGFKDAGPPAAKALKTLLAELPFRY
mgnify:CR=1 FL=1